LINTFDFAVVGAGVFGAWTARALSESGASVVLMDAYGPGNSRSSSGGETRVIRMGYGSDELYTEWAIRSLPKWQELASRTGAEIFHKTGVLWLASAEDSFTQKMLDVLQSRGVLSQRLTGEEIRSRWPQLNFPEASWAVFEPESGLLMARKSVQLLVAELGDKGIKFLNAGVTAPQCRGKLQSVRTTAGDEVSAGTYIFACGPWLPKVFPEVLSGRIFPSRQEVFFLGPPPGDEDFGPQKMPVWLFHQHPDIPYALPNMESRGFKIAFDRHGSALDPDGEDRVIGKESIARLHAFLAQHLPALKDAPIVETRVCQYENTWNGDFLIDRHPEAENVWMVGGGSGHGFKHGPAVGEYVRDLIMNARTAEPRFSLASKKAQQARAVY